MASPMIDGYGGSTAGVALAAVTQAPVAPRQSSPFGALSTVDDRLGQLGIGVIAATAVLVYLFKRIL